MARNKPVYVCSECGEDHTVWTGQCRACGAWNTLQTMRSPPSSGSKAGEGPIGENRDPGQTVLLTDIAAAGESRLSTGLDEMNQVLGGGMVPGTATLIGGDPGIGKSTLLLAVLTRLAPRMRTLYVSGEESARQIKLRAERLGVADAPLRLLPENRLETVLSAIETWQPEVLAIDSIQTIAWSELSSAAGSVTQVRECAARLIQSAKTHHRILFLVSHVTKDGLIAGPKLLEHMVDTVLYFEGERHHRYRILRSIKNRFGPTNEIGVFEMRDSGLEEVANPSELFLSERVQGAAGSVVFPGVEGTRPVLVEIQALVTPTPLSQPRRATLGVDAGRLAMLTAVMEKRLGLGLFDRDIYLNAAGGFRISEPAADLAVAMAIFSSHRNIAVDPQLVILGEIGLAGEIRRVAHVETRVREAARLGFNRCILPTSCLNQLGEVAGMRLTKAATLQEAAEGLVF